MPWASHHHLQGNAPWVLGKGMVTERLLGEAEMSVGKGNRKLGRAFDDVLRKPKRNALKADRPWTH